MRQLLLLLTVLPVLALLPLQAHAAADFKATLEDATPVKTDVTSANAQTAPVAEEAAPVEGVESDAAAHTADAAHAEEGKGGLPQLDIATYPSQIFWLLVAFFVLYIGFSKSVLPTIGSVVATRETLIKNTLDSAQALKDRADEIKAAYEQTLDNARGAAVQAVQDVENMAKKKAADQSDAFRKQADDAMKAAEARVQSAKDKALGDMSHIAAEVASVAAEKITGVSTDMQKAKAIVDSIAEKAKAA